MNNQNETKERLVKETIERLYPSDNFKSGLNWVGMNVLLYNGKTMGLLERMLILNPEHKFKPSREPYLTPNKYLNEMMESIYGFFSGKISHHEVKKYFSKHVGYEIRR